MMKRLLNATLVAGCGLLSSLLTVLLVELIRRFTGFVAFSATAWFFVPMGAIVCGAAAASGYVIGSIRFLVRPSPVLLIQMIVIALGSYALMFYLPYRTTELPNGRWVKDIISFQQYLDLALTTPSFRVQYSVTMVHVGPLGYLLALLQVSGFLMGGLFAYGKLLDLPTCERCKDYIRTLFKSQQNFDTSNVMAAHYNALLQLQFDSAQFPGRRPTIELVQFESGHWALIVEICGCPTCKAQKITYRVAAWNGKKSQWIRALAQDFAVPQGGDIVRAFATAAPHSIAAAL